MHICHKCIFRHALALASKHGKHDLYLAIMVEVEGDHKEALAYMEKLPLSSPPLPSRIPGFH